MINRFPEMDTYFTEINHVLLASRGYESTGTIQDVLYYVLRRKKPTGVAEIA
jgi:hypothetical protein